MPTTRTSQVDPASSSLLSIEQLADWLGVTDRFIRRLVAARRIPFLKIGKFIRLTLGIVHRPDRARRNPSSL